MQRKPGFPLGNCNIKIPDAAPAHPEPVFEEDWERRRQQLINFGHQQWGFNNWSWSVTKQDLDFVDFVNGKHTAGVASFVSVTVKSLDIHRENVGYATTTAPMKGSAIYQARKGAVTNALRETLLSFGGAVASELLELLEASPAPAPAPAPALAEPLSENNQNIMNKLPEPKNVHSHLRKDDAVPVAPVGPHNVRPPPAHAPAPPAHAPAPPAHAPAPPAPHPVKLAGKVAALPPAPRAAPPPPLAPPPRHNNDAQKPVTAPSLDGMSDEEARAERKRRQRQAQEEFRLKQLMKTSHDADDRVDKQELHKSSFDNLLLGIPTQDIHIEESGVSADKRKSPEPGGGGAAKRRASAVGRLDIVTD